jgi:hypothetical protein
MMSLMLMLQSKMMMMKMMTMSSKMLKSFMTLMKISVNVLSGPMTILLMSWKT